MGMYTFAATLRGEVHPDSTRSSARLRDAEQSLLHAHKHSCLQARKNIDIFPL